MSQRLSTNTWGVAKWVVSADATQGTHTTIAGAIASASSGDTILIRDGTYTENLTGKAGINLVALPGDSAIPNVTITGKLSYTGAGTMTLSNIRLQTNGDYLLEITGAAASVVNLFDCFLRYTSDAINVNNASASLSLGRCTTNSTTTGIKLFNITTCTGFSMSFTTCANGGSSTTASTMAAGATSFFSCAFAIPFNFTGTSNFGAQYISWNNAPINTTCLTINNSGQNGIGYSGVGGGTASAVIITSGSLTVVHCNIDSTNTNAMTGAGTLVNGPMVFTNTSSTVNVTTQTPLSVGPRIQLGSGVAGAGGSQIMSGTGSPDTVVTAPQGSLYLRKDGNAPYFNTNGSTAWTAIGVTWSVITVNQTAAVNSGYICNKAGTLTLALPSASAVGDIIEVTGVNTALGWQFTQASGQQIFFGTSSSTLGATGTITSSATRDALKIVCITANTTWQVLSSIGNPSVA